MSKYKASIYNYIFNSANSIIVIINGIILVPLYLKYIDLSTYGAWLASGNIIALLGIVESGFSSVITQKMSYAISNKNHDLFLKLAGSNILTSITMFVIIIFLGLIISPFVSDIINVNSRDSFNITIAFVLSLIASSLSITVSLLGSFPQVWQETRIFGLINIFVNIISLILLISLLILGFGVVALGIGYLVRSFLNFLFQGYHITKIWKKKYDHTPIFKYSFTLSILKECMYPFISRISNIIINNSQCFIIAIFISPKISAIYDLTSKITIALSNFVAMANGSFFALLSLTFAKKDRREINNLVKNYSLLFFTLLFTALIYSYIFSESIIHHWVGIEKYGGNVLLSLILISTLTTQVKYFLNNLLYSGGLINKSSLFDILSMILYLITLFITINSFKINAIPFSSILIGLVFIGLYLYLVKKHMQINLNYLLNIFIKFVIISFALIVVHLIIKPNIFPIKNLILYFFSFSLVYIFLLFTINPSIRNKIYKIITQ